MLVFRKLMRLACIASIMVLMFEAHGQNLKECDSLKVGSYTVIARVNPVGSGNIDIFPFPLAGPNFVSFNAYANPGYIIENWTNAVDGSEASTMMAYSFDVTTSRELIANFIVAPDRSVHISANPAAGGTVAFDPPSSQNGGADTTVPHGASLKVVATPNPGYRFVNWRNGTTVESNRAEYEFGVVTPLNLVANFELNIVHLVANPVEGGTVSFDPPSSLGGGADTAVPVGASLTAVATPNEGYRFVSWTNDVTELSTTESYTFNATENLSLVANFEANTGIAKINDNSSILIYPNPVNSITNYELRITNGEAGNNYEIYNLLGQVVKTGEAGENGEAGETGGRTLIINVESLANGMYYLKIGKTTVKFIKQ